MPRNRYFFAGSVEAGAAPGALLVLGALGAIELEVEVLALLLASFAGSAALLASDEAGGVVVVLGAGAGAAGAGVAVEEEDDAGADFCSPHAVNATTNAAARRSDLFIGVPLDVVDSGSDRPARRRTHHCGARRAPPGDYSTEAIVLKGFVRCGKVPGRRMGQKRYNPSTLAPKPGSPVAQISSKRWTSGRARAACSTPKLARG